MNHLAVMDSDDPYFQEQCLLATLWTKDSRQFWYHFAKYLNLHPGKSIPRYYQEAAFLYTDIEGGAPFKIPFDDGIEKSYMQFVKLLERFDGRDIQEAQAALYPFFGDSFFYEYYLMSHIAYF